MYALSFTKLEDPKAVLDKIHYVSIVWVRGFGKAEQVIDLEQVDLVVDPFFEALCQS